MIRKSRPMRKLSATEFLVMRDKLRLGKYRKRVKRDPEEQAILLELALTKIKKAERDNFIAIGFRRRRVNFI